jgi:hypothetical protein
MFTRKWLLDELSIYKSKGDRGYTTRNPKMIGRDFDFRKNGKSGIIMHTVWNGIRAETRNEYTLGGNLSAFFENNFSEFSKRNFWKVFAETNGLDLFFSHFYLFGFADKKWAHKNYNAWSIYSKNYHETPLWMDEQDFIVGGSIHKNLVIIAERPNGSVYAREDTGSSNLAEWPDLSTCIISEVVRLKEVFDINGNCIDPAGALQIGGRKYRIVS